MPRGELSRATQVATSQRRAQRRGRAARQARGTTAPTCSDSIATPLAGSASLGCSAPPHSIQSGIAPSAAGRPSAGTRDAPAQQAARRHPLGVDDRARDRGRRPRNAATVASRSSLRATQWTRRGLDDRCLQRSVVEVEPARPRRRRAHRDRSRSARGSLRIARRRRRRAAGCAFPSARGGRPAAALTPRVASHQARPASRVRHATTRWSTAIFRSLVPRLTGRLRRGCR